MEERQQRGEAREKQLARSDYFADSYFEYVQLWSFTEQIRHIREMTKGKIVEVGIGNGFVSSFLKSSGMQVLTCDINENLNPDIVAPVEQLRDHIGVDEYDLISCCEVLEHLPFARFEEVIGQFALLADQLFLTLPVSGIKVGAGGFWTIRWRKRWFHWWWALPIRRTVLEPMHFWEIGSSCETRLRSLIGILGRHYQAVDTGYFKLNPYHRYFRCVGRRHAQALS